MSSGIPGLEISPGASDVYPPNIKDPTGIKTPQLPFGEGVAVATSAAS